MLRSQWVSVQVDLGRVRNNARSIAARVGVPLLAVVKADAYGLGIAPVCEAIADLVAGWCVFSLTEAAEAALWQRTGKGSLALGPAMRVGCEPYLAQRVRPAVGSVEQADALRGAGAVLCIDTGMQRFACPPEDVPAALKAGACTEAYTHATRLEHVKRLLELAGGRGLKLHAAGTALLDEPAARLDAVRPGLALYRGAVRVSTRLVEARDTRGPAGYSGFAAQRHGVILCGYSSRIRKGPCLVNAVRRQILEVGMQSSYVEIGPHDRVGDEVVLLGDQLDLEPIAEAWSCTPHETLLRLASAGRREYAPW